MDTEVERQAAHTLEREAERKEAELGEGTPEDIGEHSHLHLEQRLDGIEIRLGALANDVGTIMSSTQAIHESMGRAESRVPEDSGVEVIEKEAEPESEPEPIRRRHHMRMR